jgi:alkanesulfonate monooxygenase SsuD/methylene tetrahydromethanopterin reductase-like flavin-dependent oxidoreductase (luciferase family)
MGSAEIVRFQPGTNDGPPAVMYPLMPLHADLVAPYAHAAAAAGARRLWMGQSLVAESHQVFAYLAGMGVRVPVGLGVTLVPLRHPFEAAVQARSLALLTGSAVVAGYGTATPRLVAALGGSPYARPATAAAGYADAVRATLAGRVGGHECETCASQLRLPSVPHPQVEVGLGVLRPAMARAAAAVADVAITWLTPPGYVREVLAPALAAGATGRDRPPRIATVLQVAIDKPGRDPLRLALASVGGHLRAPHYTDMLRLAGVPADPAHPAAGARALVEMGVFAFGTPDDIAERVRAHYAAGVDEVILNPAGVAATEGSEAAVEDLAEILAGCGRAGRAAGAVASASRTVRNRGNGRR